MRRWVRRQMRLPTTSVPLGLAKKSAPFSVWLYVKTIFVKWRSLAAVVLFAVGLLAFLKYRISLALPLSLAILFALFLVANIQLFHQTRAPSQDESLGLPYWAEGALNARGEGSHLTVLLCGIPVKKLWTQEDYEPIILAAVRAFHLPTNEMEISSFHNVLRVGFPKIPNPVFQLQAGVAGSGFLSIKYRLVPPLEIADVMVRIDDMIKFVNSDVNRYLIEPSKIHAAVLALNDWPAEGVNTNRLVSARRLSHRYLAGNQVLREYGLAKKTDTWAITKDFAGVLLAESGYVGFQEELARQTRRDLEG